MVPLPSHKMNIKSEWFLTQTSPRVRVFKRRFPSITASNPNSIKNFSISIRAWIMVEFFVRFKLEAKRFCDQFGHETDEPTIKTFSAFFTRTNIDWTRSFVLVCFLKSSLRNTLSLLKRRKWKWREIHLGSEITPSLLVTEIILRSNFILNSERIFTDAEWLFPKKLTRRSEGVIWRHVLAIGTWKRIEI